MDANELVNVSGGSAFVRKPLGKVTNYCQNPSFNADSILTPLMTNLAAYGSFETAQSGTTEVRRNLMSNGRLSVGSTGWSFSGSASRSTSTGLSSPTGLELNRVGTATPVATFGGTSRMPVIPGAVYAASALTMLPLDNRVAIDVIWYTSAGSQIGISNRQYAGTSLAASTTVLSPGIPGRWGRGDLVAPANAALAGIRVYRDNGVDGVVTVTEILLEQTDQLRPYFDGSSPNEKGFTTEWAGTANASASIMRAATATLIENLARSPIPEVGKWQSSAAVAEEYTVDILYDSEGAFARGTRVSATATTYGIRVGYNTDGASLPAGSNAASIQVKGTPGTTAAVAVRQGTGFANVSELVNVAITANWQTVNVPFTLASAAGAISLIVISYGSNAQGSTIDARRLSFSAGTVALPYVDGSTPNSGDFINAWSGAANASTSVQQRVLLASSTGFNPPGTRSTLSWDWASAGFTSLRITPTSGSNDIFFAPGGATGFTLGMQAGKTYTAVARVRLTQALVGNLRPNRARRIVTFVNTSTSYIETPSNDVPNAAGEYITRVTFSVPQGATEAFIRLYNGAPLDGGDVWWDGFTLVEGNYPDLMPFDGSTPDTVGRDYYWNGTPFASTSSIGYSRQPDQDGGFTYQFAGSRALGVLAGDSAKLGPIPYGIESIKGKVGHVSFDVMSLTEAIPIGATVAIIRFSDGESARLQNNVNIPAGTRGRVGWELDLTMVEDFYGITGFELTNDQAGAGSVTIFDRILVTDSIIRP